MLNEKSKQLLKVCGLVILAIVLSGCSLLGNKIESAKCKFTYTTELHEKLNATAPTGLVLKDVDSFFYSYAAATASLKNEVKCLLSTFKGKIKKVTYVTFYIKDIDTSIQYILDPEEDIVMELQLAPLDEGNYLVLVTTMFPLNSVLESMSGGKKKVVVLDRRQGKLTKESFNNTLSFLSNGKFSK